MRPIMKSRYCFLTSITLERLSNICSDCFFVTIPKIHAFGILGTAFTNILLEITLILLWVPFHAHSFNDPRFRFWTVEDGLAESTAVYVHLSPQGNLIVSGCSVNYHALLDGYRVHKIPTPYSHAYFQQDKNGVIWSFLTDRKYGAASSFLGFQRYRPSRDDWVEYPIPQFADLAQSSTERVQVSYIGIDPWGEFVAHASGQLVFSYYDKVFSYIPRENTLKVILRAANTQMHERYKPFLESQQTIPLFGYRKDFLSNVYQARDGGIWISTLDGVIKGRWAADNSWKWTEYSYPEALYPTTGYLHHLIEWEDGTLFAKAELIDREKARAGSEDILLGKRLLQFRDNRWEILMEQEKTNTTFGWLDSRDRLWYSDTDKTYIKDGTQETMIFPTVFYDIAYESETRFFAGTSQSMVRHAKPLWTTPRALQDISAYGMDEDKQGTLWLSNSDCLISYKNNKTNVNKIDPSHFQWIKQTGHVCVMPDNHVAVEVWSATPSGIFLFDPKTETFSHFCGPNGENLCDIFFVGEETWFATTQKQGGWLKDSYRMEDGQLKLILALKQIKRRPVNLFTHSIAKTENGDIWISHADPYGPIQYKPNGETVLFDDPDVFPGTGCFVLLSTGGNTIWCAGQKEVCAYDGASWKIVYEGSDYAFDMIEDRKGLVWLSCKNGVHCYNPKRENSWVHYTIQDGLPSNTASNLFEDSHGTIWVTTQKGVSQFNPDADPYPPIVW
ncbi:hypothetical protein GF373_05635, partial [bacterium]|nr:hypothetical protein [bacterium]